jgi:hypothetical protein
MLGVSTTDGGTQQPTAPKARYAFSFVFLFFSAEKKRKSFPFNRGKTSF